jgi:hypothetical protein
MADAVTVGADRRTEPKHVIPMRRNMVVIDIAADKRGEDRRGVLARE